MLMRVTQIDTLLVLMKRCAESIWQFANRISPAAGSSPACSLTQLPGLLACLLAHGACIWRYIIELCCLHLIMFREVTPMSYLWHDLIHIHHVRSMVANMDAKLVQCWQWVAKTQVLYHISFRSLGYCYGLNKWKSKHLNIV